VSSYAIDDGSRLLLFDPIAPPSEIVELAEGRETAIVLTAPWHERDARSLVERLGWPVFSPAPDSQEDLMRMFAPAPRATGGACARDARRPDRPGRARARARLIGDLELARS
jgi:hypothetical protein